MGGDWVFFQLQQGMRWTGLGVDLNGRMALFIVQGQCMGRGGAGKVGGQVASTALPGDDSWDPGGADGDWWWGGRAVLGLVAACSCAGVPASGGNWATDCWWCLCCVTICDCGSTQRTTGGARAP
jgi:hypothetical protein